MRPLATINPVAVPTVDPITSTGAKGGGGGGGRGGAGEREREQMLSMFHVRP
jgi:hypothetical protein